VGTPILVWESSFYRLLGFQPLGEFFDTFLEGGLGLVAEEFCGFGDVGPGLGDVAGLFGVLVDDGFFAEGLFDRLYHFGEADGAVVAEVEDFEGGIGVVDGGPDAGEDVFDVGVIASGAAVSEEGDGFPGQDHFSEFVDGKVGALTGAVNGKEAQGDEADVVEFGVDVAKAFAGQLGGGVGGYGLEVFGVFFPGDFGVDAVDGGGGGEDELFDVAGFGELQEVEGAFDIGVVVADGVSNGGADSGFGRNVDDGVDGAGYVVCGVKVADVGLEPGEVGMVDDFGDVLAFDGRVVEGVQVINNGDLVAVCE